MQCPRCLTIGVDPDEVCLACGGCENCCRCTVDEDIEAPTFEENEGDDDVFV